MLQMARVANYTANECVANNNNILSITDPILTKLLIEGFCNKKFNKGNNNIIIINNNNYNNNNILSITDPISDKI